MARREYVLKDADITKLALCKVGANRHRVFLFKSADGDDEERVAAFARLIKEPGENWRTAYVPVAVPGSEEDQGIFTTGAEDVDVWDGEDEIRQAAHSFMANGAQVVAKHFENTQAKGVSLVENAVALDDLEVGDKTIKKGTWYVALRFDDAETRDLVAKGEIDAVSVEGFATRVAKDGIVHADRYDQVAADPSTVNLDRFSDPMHPELVEAMVWCEGRAWAQFGEAPPTPPDNIAKEIQQLAKDAILVPDKPGARNWIDRTGTGDLPKFIGDIAGDLMTERGKTTGQAIELAVGIVRNWCHGHGNVTAKTRAKACAASAEWEAKKAQAHAVAKDGWSATVEDVPRDTLLRRVAKTLGLATDECPCGCFEWEAADEEEWPFGDCDALAKAKLDAADRKKLPKSAFVFPEKAPGSGSYPIHDRSHAANALARAKGKSEETKVRRAVCSRHPDLPACKQMAKALDDDTGTVEDVGDANLTERVDQLATTVEEQGKQLGSLIGTDDEPGLIAKSVEKAVEKIAKQRSGEDETPDREQISSKLEELSGKMGEFDESITELAKAVEDLEEGESDQPAAEQTSNGRVAKSGGAMSGILFD